MNREELLIRLNRNYSQIEKVEFLNMLRKFLTTKLGHPISDWDILCATDEDILSTAIDLNKTFSTQ